MMREYYLSAFVATARRGEGTQSKQNKIFYSRVDRISRIKGIKIKSWHKSRVWQVTIHRMQDTGTGQAIMMILLSMIVNTLLVAGEMVYLFSSSSALSGLSMVVCFATKLDYCYHNTEECFTHTDRFLTMCSLKITAHCNDGS